MALDPLATAPDLEARNIVVPDAVDADTLLASASSAVREAAGCAISEEASTVTFVVDDPCEFTLPFGPVTAVASVEVASVALTGWTKLGDTVRFPRGWTRRLPVEVTFTYTHGLPTVPDDIVDLVCGMVSIAATAGGAGSYGAGGRTHSVKLGDYAETFSIPEGTESPSPMALPDRTRDALAARFGSNVAVVRTR